MQNQATGQEGMGSGRAIQNLPASLVIYSLFLMLVREYTRVHEIVILSNLHIYCIIMYLLTIYFNQYFWKSEYQVKWEENERILVVKGKIPLRV